MISLRWICRCVPKELHLCCLGREWSVAMDSLAPLENAWSESNFTLLATSPTKPSHHCAHVLTRPLHCTTLPSLPSHTFMWTQNLKPSPHSCRKTTSQSFSTQLPSTSPSLNVASVLSETAIAQPITHSPIAPSLRS